MNTNLFFLILVGAFLGGASGYLGSYMVIKRMSLVGDALSHVALPGMAIAMMLGLNPMFGAFIILALATLAIWYLEEHSEIYPEALVGIFFTASLAIGLLITPTPELFEALFGNLDKISTLDGVVIVLSAILIFILTSQISQKLLLSIVSEDLAKSGKIDTAKTNLIYLLLVSLVVALGVKFVGSLLTGALVIIPAVSAKVLAGSIRSYQLLSMFLGVISVATGVLVSRFFDLTSGPVVVLVSAFFFLSAYSFSMIHKNQ